jgi:molybdate transport system substrate-binding protein
MRRQTKINFHGFLAIMLVLVFDRGSTMAASIGATQQPETINLNVDAASSLTNALQEVESRYEQSHPNVNLTNNFAASGTLAQQIQQGAPADVFFSADTSSIDALQSANLLLPGTRQNLLSNRLAVITPNTSALSLSSVQDLSSPQVRRVAVGAPSTVPAGQYAQQLLTSNGLLDQLQPKLVFGQNVRDVLNLVETGNADAGIVYITDALQSNQVKVATIPPTNEYSPIVYPVAVLQRSPNQATATDFTNFLRSDPAISVFEQFGFTRANNTPVTSVPEPNSTLGLIALGALGVGLRLKRKKTSLD